jgi:endonuclease-8
VGFNIPVAEFISGDLARHPELRRLGPDLLADDFDAAEAVRRMRARGERPIADVLLDQGAMAGIGNVYKSEILFACGVDPFAPAGSLSDTILNSLVETARRLLRVNATKTRSAMTTYAGYRRTTRRDNPKERLWVYGRGGLPCRRCGTTISVAKRGIDARLTYWCESCQRGRMTSR